MSDDHRGAPAVRPFLRLVTDAESVAAGTGLAEDPAAREVLTADLRRAAELRRETALFAAVRPSGFSPSGSPETLVEPEGALLPTVTFAPQQDPQPQLLSSAQLGERFSALSGPADGLGGKDGGERSEALQDALKGLQSQAVVVSHAQLWPAVSLGELAKVDAEAAARWIVCLAPFLHRVSPDTRLDFVIPKVGCLSMSSHRTGTDVEWLSKGRRRSRRDMKIKGSLASVGAAVVDGKGRGVRGKEALAVLRRLASAPVSLAELAHEPGSLIDPLAFWKLVEVSIPACLGDVEAIVVHRDPARPDLTATVEIRPGRPLKVSPQEVHNPDALIEEPALRLFQWALTAPLSGIGSSSLIEGSGDAEAAALRQIGRPIMPIRTQP